MLRVSKKHLSPGESYTTLKRLPGTQTRVLNPACSQRRASQGLSPEEEVRYDLVREGVVVFLGTLAKHLGAQDPKRLAVVETLVDVLRWVSTVVCLGTS